jgi:hypothetical protein
MASQLQSLDEETPLSSRVESVAYQHPILSSSWPHYKYIVRNTGVDLASALVAGSLVAPVVTVIDRFVISPIALVSLPPTDFQVDPSSKHPQEEPRSSGLHKHR